MLEDGTEEITLLKRCSKCMQPQSHYEKPPEKRMTQKMLDDKRKIEHDEDHRVLDLLD